VKKGEPEGVHPHGTEIRDSPVNSFAHQGRTNQSMKFKKSIPVLFLATAVCAGIPPCRAQSDKAKLYDKSYALVIGITKYQHQDIWRLITNAENDAKSVAQFLESTGFEVTPLLNDNATKDAIDNAFVALSTKVGPNDRVVIFFAGHGQTQSIGGKDRGFIVPYEATGSVSSWIDMADLKKYSGYLGTAKHQLFLMDSCYGGTLGRDENNTASRGILLPTDNGPRAQSYINDITKPFARDVLTAGGAYQQVLDGGAKYEGHSLFTGCLLEALKDERADTDHDGYITFSELVAYMEKNARNDKQTPHSDVFEDHVGGREFVFVCNHIRREIFVAPEFAQEDPSKGKNTPLEALGLRFLMKELERLQESEHVWNVEFKQSVGRELMTRGEKTPTWAVDNSAQGDYRIELSYLPLEGNRVRVEAQFKKNKENLPEIPTQMVEISTGSLDLKHLAEKLLRQFAPDPDLHLHVEYTPTNNCPEPLKSQTQAAIEGWLSQLSLPRVKYTKESGENSIGDIHLYIIQNVCPEDSRQVFTVSMVVQVGEETQTFDGKSDIGSWQSALRGVQEKAEACLRDVAKRF